MIETVKKLLFTANYLIRKNWLYMQMCGISPRLCSNPFYCVHLIKGAESSECRVTLCHKTL